MSRIFLPNGGQIELQNSCKCEQNEDGSMDYYTSDKENKYLGHITASGILHLTSAAKYIYHPPSISSLSEAVLMVHDNIKKLKVWELRDLKQTLQHFNSKEGIWK